MKANRPENPCQPGSAACRIINVLLKSRKQSVVATEIALKTKIKTERVNQVVSAMRNKFHNAALAKAGLAVKRLDDGGFRVEACRPKPHARRPAPKATAEANSPAASIPAPVSAEPPPAPEVPSAFDAMPDFMEAVA